LALLVGCDDGRVLRVEPDLRLDVFDQTAVRKVDVLFVIDNSPSTEDKQENLARNLAGFMTHLRDAQVDYHLAVTTTDITSPGPGAQGRLWGDPAVVTAALPDPSAAFAASVRVGSGGDAREAGLDAARRTLELNPEGFLRPDAALFLVFVSDDEDQSEPGQPRFFYRYFEGSKGKGNEGMVSGGAIVGDLPGGCTTPAGGDARPGSRYAEVVQAMGGRVGSICDPQFDVTLRELGVEAVGLKRRWPLSRLPDLSTLQVSIKHPCQAAMAPALRPLLPTLCETLSGAPADGVCAEAAPTVDCRLRPLPPGGADGWSLDASTNTLQLHGAALPPHGSRVEVRYVPQDGQP